jgi:proteasome activator subunit 4
LLVLIPVSDCSEAVHLRDDLTEEEKELCSATARFDSIVDSLLGKMFSMIEIFGTNPANNTRANLTKLTRKNIEEVVMERGIVAIIKTLLKNCSSEIYNVRI